MSTILTEVHFLAEREEKLTQEIGANDSHESERLAALLIDQEKGLDKIRKGLDRIKTMYEDGVQRAIYTASV